MFWFWAVGQSKKIKEKINENCSFMNLKDQPLQRGIAELHKLVCRTGATKIDSMGSPTLLLSSGSLVPDLLQHAILKMRLPPS